MPLHIIETDDKCIRSSWLQCFCAKSLRGHRKILVYTARKIPFMYSFSGNCVALTPISTFMCLWAIYIHKYSQDESTNTPHISRSRIASPILEILYINLSQIYECRTWETEHYNSVFGITVSFLGIQKWEPDICGILTALHLQCSNFKLKFTG